MDNDTYAVQPLPANAAQALTVRVPGSKSLTNRALVCAALASGTSVLTGVLIADDTVAMINCLRTLGVDLDVNGSTVTVVGLAGKLPSSAEVLNVNQSGTTSRFLLPVLALGSGRYVLDGHEQMRARPFGDLIDALSQHGASIEGTTMPLTVQGSGLQGGEIAIPGSVSSQFLSALLLSAPYAKNPMVFRVDGDLVSKPYVDLTLATMAAFGASIERNGYESFCVDNTGYTAANYAIEPDASAASYFFGAAALTGQSITIDGLGSEALQGDMAFVGALAQMGATVVQTPSTTTVTGPGQLTGITIDMADFSDTAQTLAVVAAFAEGDTVIDGIGFIRRKETDRIHAVVAELNRLGGDAREQPDGIEVVPRPLVGATVETYDDHRMAMSFALAGLRAPGVVIANPGCVAKTFPHFFEVFATLGQSDPAVDD
ncbi:MAG: 3-phosphoshikimate 1-carboxyvinyltransferase [Acidimicrobiales bacterium]